MTRPKKRFPVVRTPRIGRPADTAGTSRPRPVARPPRPRTAGGRVNRPTWPPCWPQQPELKDYRSVVLDLAYEEYRLRLRAGETARCGRIRPAFSFPEALALLVDRRRIACWAATARRPRQQAVSWPEPGSQFLGFKLISEIGRGTFGRVFLASEQALGERPVVLKVALQGGQEAEMLADCGIRTSCRFIPFGKTMRPAWRASACPTWARPRCPSCWTRSLPIVGLPGRPV